MGTHYQHLRDTDRYQIHALLEAGVDQKDIAHQLGVSPSTISRERRRRTTKGDRYDAATATRKAAGARRSAKWTGMKIERHPQLRTRIIEELKAGQSPECIAGRMERDEVAPRVCSDTIYRWLYSPRGLRYSSHLCSKRTKRKHRRPRRHTVVISGRVSIHERPLAGIHAEGDTFHSPKTVPRSACVALMVRPDTKEVDLRKAASQSPGVVSRCFARGVVRLAPDTLTLDNGLENRAHTTLSLPTYFCDLASPRQKPHAEGSIALVRRWFYPKGTDLSRLTQDDLDQVTEFFNNKYRKSLHYDSPRERRAMLEGH